MSGCSWSDCSFGSSSLRFLPKLELPIMTATTIVGDPGCARDDDVLDQLAGIESSFID